MKSWKKRMMVVGFACLALLNVSAKEELHIFNWTEYMDPQILKDFEAKYDCKVVESLYESNEEMVAKLQAGGISQYDIVVPSDYILESMIELKLLQKLDLSKIPNIKNLGKNFLNPPFDPKNEYTAAYQWGTVGIVYNKSKFDKPVDSWSALFDSEDGINFLLFDSEREMLGAALIYLGYSPNTVEKKELLKVADLIIKDKKKKGFMGFANNVSGRNQVMNGTVAIAVAYNGDVIQQMTEDENLMFVNPKEGTLVFLDSMAIPAKAPNPDLAYKFINYILDAKVGAALSNYNQFASPNEASMKYITPADLKNPAIYPPKETMDKLHYVLDLGKNNGIYSELWKMVKTR